MTRLTPDGPFLGPVVKAIMGEMTKAARASSSTPEVLTTSALTRRSTIHVNVCEAFPNALPLTVRALIDILISSGHITVFPGDRIAIGQNINVLQWWIF
jgi:hypothetical protein